MLQVLGQSKLFHSQTENLNRILRQFCPLRYSPSGQTAQIPLCKPYPDLQASQLCEPVQDEHVIGQPNVEIMNFSYYLFTAAVSRVKESSSRTNNTETLQQSLPCSAGLTSA